MLEDPVQNLSLYDIHSLDQVYYSKHQKSKAASQSHYQIMLAEDVVIDGKCHLPSLRLTLPAIALPPMTAIAVQIACPLTAPPVTHQ